MQIVGHRGAAGEAPENTIAALQWALHHGVRDFEIDLRLSADQQLIVSHDLNLSRMFNIDANVCDLSAAELAGLQAPVLNQHALTETFRKPEWLGVPTLAELLSQCPEIECIQLEVKSDSSTNISSVVDALGLMFPDTESASNIVVTSFDEHFLDSLKRAHPHIPLGLVNSRSTKKALATAKTLGCRFLCLRYSLAEKWSKPLVQELAQSGMHISIWTVNDQALVNKLMQLPVQSAITDYPTQLLSPTA